jgi:hypothetical protein
LRSHHLDSLAGEEASALEHSADSCSRESIVSSAPVSGEASATERSLVASVRVTTNEKLANKQEVTGGLMTAGAGEVPE